MLSELSIGQQQVKNAKALIVCVADKYVESKLLSDVKQVRDFGAFYDVVFPFGKYSEKFVCQKDLLTIGTIEDFEKLFEGRIVRKQKTEDGSLKTGGTN